MGRVLIAPPAKPSTAGALLPGHQPLPPDRLVASKPSGAKKPVAAEAVDCNRVQHRSR